MLLLMLSPDVLGFSSGAYWKRRSSATEVAHSGRYSHPGPLWPLLAWPVLGVIGLPIIARKVTWLIEKNAGRVTPLEIENAELLPDGRQRVVWETTKPVLFETYALKWVW